MIALQAGDNDNQPQLSIEVLSIIRVARPLCGSSASSIIYIDIVTS
jgi:hypothetical protein